MWFIDRLYIRDIFHMKFFKSKWLSLKIEDLTRELQVLSSWVRCCCMRTKIEPTIYRSHRKSWDDDWTWKGHQWWSLFCILKAIFIYCYYVLLKVCIFQSGNSIAAGQQLLLLKRVLAIKQLILYRLSWVDLY